MRMRRSLLLLLLLLPLSGMAQDDRYPQLRDQIQRVRNNLQRTDYSGRAALEAAVVRAEKQMGRKLNDKKLSQEVEALQTALVQYCQTRPDGWVTIQNGRLWQTPEGEPVQAHAAGFIRVGDLWYMCGEDRAHSWNPDVNLYSSTDLIHWRFERKIIENGVTSPELGRRRMIERPKLLWNAATGKYVVWCHWEASNYGASEAACLECDSVNGPYRLVWSGRPQGIKSRDCNVFQDRDGQAYFISTTTENTDLGLFALTPDYRDTQDHTVLFPGQRREAPAIVHIGERYFMFSSACTGWDPNQCKMAYSNDLRTGWTPLEPIGNPYAFDTQAAAILEIRGTRATTYLYVGDRWQDPRLPESKTILFPITFSGTECDFTYRERFDLNLLTGEWRETPTQDYYVPQQGWSIVACTSQQEDRHLAAHLIDGDPHTCWHTAHDAQGPHSVTIDMGQQHRIAGFLLTPRMDDSVSGLIRRYEFQVSADGQQWQTVSSDQWLPYCTQVDFPATDARYLRLVSHDGAASAAELQVVQAPTLTANL